MYQFEFDTSVNCVCPLYKGQTLYYVSPDGPLIATLVKSFEIGEIKRYLMKFDSYIGGHKTFSENDINNFVYTSYKKANKKCNELRSKYQIMMPEDMKISMSHSFVSYTPGQMHGNGNLMIIDAHIAIVNRNMLYIQRFADYAYLKLFDSQEELENEYIFKLQEMKDYHFKSNVLKELYVNPTIKTMYKVDAHTYAEADFIKKSEEMQDLHL